MTTRPHTTGATKAGALFILGAGASAPDGVPLQRELLPALRRSADSMLADTEIGREVRVFLDRWFGPSIRDSAEPSLEEIFGFIDTVVAHREDLSKDYPLARLEHVRESLIKCIHYTVHTRRKGEPENYRAFWAAIAATSLPVSVLSLNYDTALDEAFDRLYPIALLDFCLPLMNYDKPNSMDPFNWWIDPRGPRPEFASGARTVRLIKLHGSLSWQYCRTCREVMLTPWNRGIDLRTGRFLRVKGSSCEQPEEIVDPHVCPYCGSFFETLILPPAHHKELTHPIISHLSREASRAAREADRLVFIGYSFPEADVHLRVLLSRAVRTAKVTVIDPALSEQSRARFRSLSSRVAFIERDFARVVGNGTLDALVGND